MLFLFQNVCVYFLFFSEMFCIVQEVGGKVIDMNGNVLLLIVGFIFVFNGGIFYDCIVQFVFDQFVKRFIGLWQGDFVYMNQ